MLLTHTGATMTTPKALSLFVLVVTACEGASLVLKPSTQLLSEDGEANFTLNCTNGQSQIHNKIVDVHRMSISKKRNNGWEPIVQMESNWKSPVIHPGIDVDFDLASGFIQATWPMTDSITGEYICDMIGDGVIDQRVSLRSPVVYVDVQFSVMLYDLFKMVKTSSNKVETLSANVARNKEAITLTSADIAKNKEAITFTSTDIAKNKEAIEGAFKDIVRNKEWIERASIDIAQNEEAIDSGSGDIMWIKTQFDTASTDIARNKEAINTASADITRNEEAIQMASANIVQNKEAIETVSTDITRNKEANKKASAGIALNEEVITRTKIGQDTLNKMLQQTSNIVENNAATLAQFYKHNFTTSFIERWPQGRYDLIEPKSGCPRDTATAQWSRRYCKLPVEASGVKISTGAHMKKPDITSVGSKKYMKMEFCSVHDSPSVGSLWPPGSYCIDRDYPHTCPTGFSLGTIVYGKNDPCPGCAGTIAYCCRNDSLPDTAILLPTRTPFYLYRFGGKCQHVWGMTATEEYMVIDTECCGSKYSDPVPDGKKTSSEITLQLCYYERDTNNG